MLGAAEVALFAGVVEGRLVRGAAGLLAVFNDVRLGLEVEDLVVSFEAVALVVRVVVADFSPSGFVGDVSVRLVADFEGDALVASPFISLAFDGSFGVSLRAGFWEASSEADAAVRWDAGCASCCANAGTSSDLAVIFPLPFWAIALANSALGDPECSPVVAIPRPFPVFENRSELFWPTSASVSSELKLFTRAGDVRPSPWPLTARDCAALSTATKLARTLESCLPVPEFSEPAGDLPRDGGEGVLLLLFWLLLLSNLASRLRTPGPEDMVVVVAVLKIVGCQEGALAEHQPRKRPV